MANGESTRISDLTGEFVAPALEAEFRHAHWTQSLRQLRFVAAAGAIFYLAGVVVDWQLLGLDRSFWTLLSIRAGVALVMAAAALLATGRERRVERFDALVLAVLTIVSAATCVIIAWSPGETILHAFTVLAIVLVFYLFVPARTHHVFVIGMVFSASFVVVSAGFLRPRPDELALVVLYLLLANIVGSYSRRSVCQARRREYAILRTERTAHDSLRLEVEGRAHAEAALSESEERYRSLVELSPNAIVVHRNGEVLYVNPRGVELIGAGGPEELLGRSVFEFIVPDYHDMVRRRLTEIVETGAAQEILEIEVGTVNGRTAVCEVVSGRTTFSGKPAVQSVLRDIEDRKRLEEELMRLATTDPLTESFNRRHFFEHFDVEWARARRHHRALSVLIMDLDHFKTINDQHGHAAGDAVLKTVVEECKDLLRVEDILARMGGEEFAVLLPEIDEAGTAGAAQRIREHLAALRIPVQGGEVRLTVSIGVAECRLESETPGEALKRADAALYAAKDAGRNKVRVG